MAIKYRIGEIGWHNFERLVKTLLKAVIAPGVTSFGGTKDKGRDAAFSGSAAYPSKESPWGGEWIFQVKYVDSDDQGSGASARTALLNAFKKEMESILERHGQVSCDNYLLVTNVPLTAAAREKLDEIARAAGYEGRFQVVDGHEVCEWLDIHPELRRSFPQLLGIADLQQIVNSAVYSRSRAYLDQWAPKLALFVQTDAYIKALKVLNKHHFLILDGPPETGKSMIAAATAVLYAALGYEVLDVRSPEEVHRVLRQGGKKIFIADDAIGSVSLESDKNDAWARDLPGIIRALNGDQLLVWTARHYILEAAITNSALGDMIDTFPGHHEVVVEIGDLRSIEKAEMLYNHAKNAKLPKEQRAILRRRARQLAEHPNFTPERIRQIIEYLRQNPSLEAKSISNEIDQFLTNPSARWAKAYKALSPSEQALLISLLDLDESPDIVMLQAAYAQRVRELATPARFEQALSMLKHSFVTLSRTYQGRDVVNFKHPSLRDLLLSELRNDATARRRYIELTSPSGLVSLIQGLAGKEEISL